MFKEILKISRLQVSFASPFRAKESAILDK